MELHDFNAWLEGEEQLLADRRLALQTGASMGGRPRRGIDEQLEDDIRKEMALVDEQLRKPENDSRPTVSTGLLQRREALRWVLDRAGLR